MKMKTLLVGVGALSLTLGACASDKAGITTAASAGDTTTTTTTADSTGRTTASTRTTAQATTPVAPVADPAMPPPPAETTTSATTTTTASTPTAAEPATATTTTSTTEAVKAVTMADVKTGAVVYDSAGEKLGTVSARDKAGVTIKAGTVNAKLPYASIGMNSKGLVIAVTKAEFEAAAKAKK